MLRSNVYGKLEMWTRVTKDEQRLDNNDKIPLHLFTIAKFKNCEQT